MTSGSMSGKVPLAARDRFPFDPRMTSDFSGEKAGPLNSGDAVEMLSTADISGEKTGPLNSEGAVKMLSTADTISRNDASGFDHDWESGLGLDAWPSWPPTAALGNDASLRASS